MESAKRNGELGCLSAVLGHLLSRRGASRCPMDVIGYLDSELIGPGGRCLEVGDKLGEGKDELGAISVSGRRAGVVARLMGLETLPDVKPVCSKPPDMFSRSRSVDFVDNSLLEVDLSSSRARQHNNCRVSASALFREVPLTVPSPESETKENNLIVFILENHEKLAEKEDKTMHGKSRKSDAQSRKMMKKKKTSDYQSIKESKASKPRDEPRIRSLAWCINESGRSNNARAAYEKKCSSLYRSVLDKFDHCPKEIRASRILDPVIISHRKKAAAKRKEKVVDRFTKIGKQTDNNAVKKAHRLAVAKMGKSCRLMPGPSEHDEIYTMMEGEVIDGLLEEFCEDEWCV
ncbi:hypothetical protein MLD38_029965 [Melastoma candidum]|uniref:Uncharacterized protein n=1 Tax=Melastoma candidum TaxID=119954 RepID=A0ACB9MJX8_9MYRT|nr:hypothetical protein MLD38_029965 [Melastoma candidum]